LGPECDPGDRPEDDQRDRSEDDPGNGPTEEEDS